MKDKSLGQPVVDLTLIKRLVSELEQTLTDGYKLNTETTKNEYIVEMSKALGLTTGIVSEATMLMGDIGGIMRFSSSPASLDGSLAKVLGGTGTPSKGSPTGSN